MENKLPWYSEPDEELLRDLHPEKYLIAAVMHSGVIEEDIEYFNSKIFLDHCWMLGVNSEATRASALKAIKRKRK